MAASACERTAGGDGEAEVDRCPLHLSFKILLSDRGRQEFVEDGRMMRERRSELMSPPMRTVRAASTAASVRARGMSPLIAVKVVRMIGVEACPPASWIASSRLRPSRRRKLVVDEQDGVLDFDAGQRDEADDGKTRVCCP